MPTIVSGSGGRPAPKGGQPAVGANRMPVIAAITIVALLVAAFAIWRTATASSHDADENKATIAAVERAAASHPTAAPVGPLGMQPKAGLALPGNKGRR